ncbi:TonB-dependent receptor [Hyphococcus sp.]|uniref:TonB-dependent receptor n=1 Tax=Hyphococcus sp. TaxID=2038636 RepID=UPI003D0971FF
MHRVLLCSAALSALAVNAAAQTNDDPFRDEIIVYTQKREQSVQDVPIAVTAYSEEQLKALGVQQFDDLADFVPGLEVQEQSPNNPGFVIRGITSDSGAANIEPRVSVFQDGVSVSRSRGSFVELFDASVEVAKGPQSTLFGRSALIGAINIIQNKPTYEFGAELRAGYGNYDYQLVDGFVNIPLAEDLAAFRGSFRYKKRDGYVENGLGGADFNGFELAAFRGALRLDPMDTLRIDVIGNYQSDNNSGTSFKSGTFIPSSGDIAPWAPADLNTFGGFEGGEELGVEREVWGVTGLVQWDVTDAVSINSVTGYREFDSLEVFDPDGFALPLFVFAEDAQGEQFSQELRISYDDGGFVSGFVGASYFSEDGSQRVPLQFDERAVQALLGGFLFTDLPGAPQPTLPIGLFPDFNADPGSPLFLTPLKPVHAEEFSNFGETDAYEVFADLTFRLTEDLELIVGARYSSEDKRVGYNAGLLNGASALTGAGLFIGATAFNNFNTVYVDGDFDGFTWRAALNYALGDNLNLYFNYGRGRRPEVLEFNNDTSSIGVNLDEFVTIPAETVDSYELGFKARGFDGALLLDMSGYYYSYTNFQSSIVTGAGMFETINAGSANAVGLEAVTVYQPADWARIFATYSYNKSRFDETDEDGNPLAFADNQFRLSPDHSVSVGGTFSAAAPYGVFSLTPAYVYRTKVFFDDNNDFRVNPINGALLQPLDFFQDEFQDGYGIFDMRLRFDSADDRWSAELFVENLFDKEFIIDAGNTGDGFGIPTFIAGAPRMFGGYLTVRY